MDSVLRVTAVAALVLLGGSCRGGCRGGGDGAEVDRTLAALPADARFVVSVDLARIRGTSAWKRVAALAESNPEDRRRIEELTVKTGLDPLRQIHRIVAAFPDDARKDGQFALLVDGQGFDEKRLVAYAREQSGGGDGQAIEQRRHGGRRLLWTNPKERTSAFFQGTGRFVLGAGGWGEVLADLADGVAGVPSAAGNAELVQLGRRIDRGRAVWFAAVVPLDVRQMLLADPRQDRAASVTRLAGALDLGPGLRGDLVADLSNAADARGLAERLQLSIKEAKRNATVLLLGLAPYLDGISVKTEGPSLRVGVALSEPQVNDLLERAAAFAAMARAKQERPAGTD